jgi:hypothetical protein
MRGQIFISYRRQESGWSARSLHDRLCREFNPDQIFMDLDAIALGEDFVDAIETTVAICDVLIAVIGNNWLTSKDERGGRRLDSPEDFVRMEIGTALKRKIRVIPVLVDGALMPRADDLPEDLKPLVRRNALAVTTISFEGDLQRLAGAIRQVLEKVAADQREKERLEAEQREKERLDAVQREKERLEAEQREGEETGRVPSEILERQENGQLDPRHHEQKEPLRSEHSGRKETGEKKPESRHPKLRILDRYSWVPFALSLFSWVFISNGGSVNAFLDGGSILEYMLKHPREVQVLLLCLTAPTFALISSFFRYRRILEAAVSAVSVFYVIFWICILIMATNAKTLNGEAYGVVLGLGFQVLGTFIRVWLLIRRRELEEI